MKKHIIASVSNNIVTDQRLEKVCGSLIKAGFSVELIGSTNGGKVNLKRAYKTTLIPVVSTFGFFFYLEFNLKLLVHLLFKKKKNVILLSNDLDTLLPNFMISKIFGLPLVYDSHEIFSELPSLKGKRIRKKTWKLLEAILIPRIQHFYTVSNSYANWFEKKYENRPKVIRNVPILRDYVSNEVPKIQLPNNPNQEKIVLYQGAINKSRGIDKMILAMQFVENVQLWIAGDGPMKKEYQKLSDSLNLNNKKVFFLGRIEPDVLRKITPLADIGLSLEEDNGLSYRYALPNKVFDYIHAGVPVLGTYLDEIAELIVNYKVGETIESHQPEHIAKKIKEMLAKGNTKYVRNLSLAAKELHWKAEEEHLLSIYDFESK